MGLNHCFISLAIGKRHTDVFPNKVVSRSSVAELPVKGRHFDFCKTDCKPGRARAAN